MPGRGWHWGPQHSSLSYSSTGCPRETPTEPVQGPPSPLADPGQPSREPQPGPHSSRPPVRGPPSPPGRPGAGRLQFRTHHGAQEGPTAHGLRAALSGSGEGKLPATAALGGSLLTGRSHRPRHPTPTCEVGWDARPPSRAALSSARGHRAPGRGVSCSGLWRVPRGAADPRAGTWLIVPRPAPVLGTRTELPTW